MTDKTIQDTVMLTKDGCLPLGNYPEDKLIKYHHDSKYQDLLHAYEDTKRLARLIDVALCGEENAAKQASLCDLVSTAKELRRERDDANRLLEEARDTMVQYGQGYSSTADYFLDEINDINKHLNKKDGE